MKGTDKLQKFFVEARHESFSSQEGSAALLVVQPAGPAQAQRRREHPPKSRVVRLLVHPRHELVELNPPVPVRVHLLENFVDLLLRKFLAEADGDVRELPPVDVSRHVRVDLVEDLQRLPVEVAPDPRLRLLGLEPLHELLGVDLPVPVLVHGVEDGLDPVVGEGLPESDGHLLDLLHVEEAGPVRVDLAEDVHGLLEGREPDGQVVVDGDASPVGFEVVLGGPDLPRLDLLAPPQLLGHDVRHPGQRLHRRLAVQEGEAGSAGEDVLDGAGVLLARETDLGLDVGVVSRERDAVSGPSLPRRLAVGQDFPRASAVGPNEMLRHDISDSVLLNQLNRETLRIPLPSVQKDVQRVTLGMPVPQYLVQHVLGHLPPRRPLPPGDERHPALWILRYDVIPRHLPTRRGVRIGRQRPPPSPRAEHVRPPDLHVLAQILLALLEHPPYLLLGRVGERLGVALLVGRADDDAPLPGEEEEEPAVGGVVIEESHVVGGVVAGEDDVRPGRSLHGGLDGLGRSGLLLTQRVGEGTPREYHVLGVNLEGVAGDAIQCLHAHDHPVLVEDSFRHFNVVGDVRPPLRGGHGDRQIRPRVVVLPLVEHRAVLDLLLVQLRKLRPRLLPPHDEAGRARELTQPVVKLEHGGSQHREEREKPVSEGRGPDVPLGERADDGDPVGQVALLVEHVLSFLVALEDHPEFAVEVVGGLDGTVEQSPREERRGGRGEVLDPRPDELRGSTGRLGREVSPLDARHGQRRPSRRVGPRGGVERHARPRGAPSDHQHVVRLVGRAVRDEPADLLGPAGYAPRTGRLPAVRGSQRKRIADALPPRVVAVRPPERRGARRAELGLRLLARGRRVGGEGAAGDEGAGGHGEEGRRRAAIVSALAAIARRRERGEGSDVRRRGLGPRPGEGARR
mmetsp:Transcript_28038/g.59555  ORF Transcript_28038/g.59555 Transcript_28038/m.59555 type:complete len:908 (+) Transcript_28038:343-3066(+)